MNRVAFVGAGSVAQWRAALDDVRRRYGEVTVVCANEHPPACDLREIVSFYGLDPRDGDRARELRDRDMLAHVRAVVFFEGDTYRVTESEMETKQHNFLWFDLETTGLDPREGVILEFAAVLCEDAAGDDFAIVQQYSGVVHCDSHAGVDPYVARMHEANGLWREAEASTTTIAEVDAFLSAFAVSQNPKPHSIVLAGNSVHFDLAWCRVHLPQFAERLSHRVFDVSTLLAAARVYAPGFAITKGEAHRALADVHESIALARQALRALRGAK